MIESKNPILLNRVLQGRQASWPDDAPQRRSYPQLAKPYLNSFLPRFTPAPQICNGNYSMEKIAGDLGSDGVTFQAWLRKNGCRSLKRTGGGARPPFRPKLSQRHICINFFSEKKSATSILLMTAWFFGVIYLAMGIIFNTLKTKQGIDPQQLPMLILSYWLDFRIVRLNRVL